MLSQFSLSDPQSQDSSVMGFKRARVVCSRCHERKVKCDSQVSKGQKSWQCSNCKDAGSLCQLRPSRRGTGRRAQRTERTNNSFDIVRTTPEAPPPISDITPTTGIGYGSDHPNQVPMQILFPPSASAVAPLAIPAERSGNEGLSDGTLQVRPSYFGDTGYMQIFSHQDAGVGSASSPQLSLDPVLAVDVIPAALQESHLETYFEYGRIWCPVLDRETYDKIPEFQQSLLLKHALALCGNEINPSLIPHTSSSEHYNRAKGLIYGNWEANPLIRIISIMLFYWWSAGPTNIVSMDTTWWWTGIAVRLAQQVGLHREVSPGQALIPGETPGVRRRIWWSLVARERITSLSQGRPCIIDLADCDTRLPTPDDFPGAQEPCVSAFINWLSLCEIIGRIGIHLRRNAHANSSAVPLVKELVSWVQSLSTRLQPSIGGHRTKGFHRDVHGLHLTYLSSITLMNLSRAAQPLPKASIAAMVAASCTARIFQDYLLRGSLRFLAGQAAWYITIAILALLHTRTFESLRVHADADIKILRESLKEMARFWHIAKMFQTGLDKIFDADRIDRINHNDMGFSPPPTPPVLDELAPSENVNWLDYFPYVTRDTSPLIASLFANSQAMNFTDLGWTFDLQAHLNQFFSRSEEFNVDFFTF